MRHEQCVYRGSCHPRVCQPMTSKIWDAIILNCDCTHSPCIRYQLNIIYKIVYAHACHHTLAHVFTYSPNSRMKCKRRTEVNAHRWFINNQFSPSNEISNGWMNTYVSVVGVCVGSTLWSYHMQITNSSLKGFLCARPFCQRPVEKTKCQKYLETIHRRY